MNNLTSASPPRNGDGCEGSAISPEHVAYLGQRAVPVEVAIRAGLRSVDSLEAAELLRRSECPSGGLAIPYEGEDGARRYWRVRLDYEGPKWLAPAGEEVPVWVPPGFRHAAGERLVVVEGPVKALALHAAGFPCIGLSGTGTTLTDDRALNSSWSRLSLAGAEVILMFDNDRKSNPNVMRDEARLGVALKAAGARVLLARLP